MHSTIYHKFHKCAALTSDSFLPYIFCLHFILSILGNHIHFAFFATLHLVEKQQISFTIGQKLETTIAKKKTK